MMFILARHAEAEDGPQMDVARPLTSDGEAQIRIMADFLLGAQSDIGLVLHSDMRRGHDTAEGIAKLLDVDTWQDPDVGPHATVAEAWAAITKAAKRCEEGKLVLVVTHAPLIKILISDLLNSRDGDLFHFSYGSMCKFETDPEPGVSDMPAVLHWMVTAKLAKRLIRHDAELIEAALAVADAALELETDEAGQYYYEEILQKRSQTGDSQSGPCENCDDNEDAGWIDSEGVYPSGHDGPPFHPNCVCIESYRSSRKRVYV